MANREQVANYSLFALPRTKKGKIVVFRNPFVYQIEDEHIEHGYEYTPEKIARELESCDSHEKMED